MEAVAASRLSEVLTQYHSAFPAVELQINTAPTGDLIEQTINGELDIAFASDPPKDQRLTIVPVYQETLVLVSSSQMADITHPSQLPTGCSILGFTTRCRYRSRLEAWLNQAEMVPNVVEINSYHALLNCVTAGMGVGLVPEKLLQCYPFKQGLKTHSLPKALRDSTTCLIWRHDSQRASLDAFVDIVKTTATV